MPRISPSTGHRVEWRSFRLNPDRRYGVSGAQPAELFLEALQTACREAQPAS